MKLSFLVLSQCVLIYSTQASSELEKCAKVTDHELQPQCEFSTGNNDGTVQQFCLENAKVLRIVGDYKTFYITCTSLYQLKFAFDGMPRTPDTFNITRSQKNIATKYGPVVQHTLSVKVFSVSFLSDSKNNANLERRERSRTGNYRFFGDGHFRDFSVSYYIFFEEPLVTAKLIRNKNTKSADFKPGYVCAVIPCRSTHYDSNVTLELSEAHAAIKQSSTNGFTVCGLTKRQAFKCRLKQDAAEDVISIEDSSYTGPSARFEYNLLPEEGKESSRSAKGKQKYKVKALEDVNL